MVSSCSVPGCKNRFKKGEMAMYKLPTVRTRNFGAQEPIKSALRRQKWLAAIKRRDLEKKEKLEHARVCCKHFITGRPAKLEDETHPDWVPSINLDGRQEKPPARKVKELERYLRSKERLNKDLVPIPVFEPEKNYKEDTCVVPGCSNVGHCKEGIRYHRFPHDSLLFAKWERQLEEGPRKLPALSRKSLVCSEHFLDSDYVINDSGFKLWLKVEVYPSVFPWNKDDIEILPVDNCEEELEVFDDDQSKIYIPVNTKTEENSDDDTYHDNEAAWSDDAMDFNAPQVNLCAAPSEFVDMTDSRSILRLLLQGDKEEYCGVPTCKKQPSQGVVLHSIPQGNALILTNSIPGEQQCINIAKAWTDLAQIKETDKICSAHFLSTDYIPGQNWVLLPNACPSLNLPLISDQQPTYSVEKPQVRACEKKEEPPTDITNLCRICIAPCDKEAVPIFSVLGYEHGIKQNMQRFLGIKVKGYDAEMPLKICKTCFLRLEDSQQFADLASSNNRKLRQMVAKQKLREGKQVAEPPPLGNDITVNVRDEDACLLVDLEEEKEEEEEGEANKKVTKPCPPFNKPCPHCPIIFNRKTTLDKHLIKNHKIFLCHKCDLEFRDKVSYDEHVTNTHYIACKLCSTSIMDTALQTHLKQAHPTLLPKYIPMKKLRYEKIKCKLCNKYSGFRRSAKKHYFWTHQVYACDICLNIFPSLVEQEKHLLEVHMIPCPYCEEKFYTIRRFHRHVNQCKTKNQSHEKYSMDVLKKSSEQIFECKFCERGLSNIFNVKQHNFWIHSKYTCLICFSTFASLIDEEEHFGCHGHMCVWCETRYESNEELREHMQCVHVGHDKTFCCEDCGECFQDKQQLKEHRPSHNKESPMHLCEVCGKTFLNTGLLYQHSVSHKTDKDKQKECHICHKRFLFDCQLKIHISSHANEDKKPFKCSICNNTFVKLEGLERHIQYKHVNFTCDYCDHSFTNKGNLKFHLRHVHFCK